MELKSVKDSPKATSMGTIMNTTNSATNGSCSQNTACLSMRAARAEAPLLTAFKAFVISPPPFRPPDRL